jgi:hypothetical protein
VNCGARLLHYDPGERQFHEDTGELLSYDRNLRHKAIRWPNPAICASSGRITAHRMAFIFSAFSFDEHSIPAGLDQTMTRDVKKQRS